MGGIPETEPKRIIYAQTIRRVVDSIFANRPTANIILMGDFNDEPGDSSIKFYLKTLAPSKNIAPKSLYNLMAPLKEKGAGSIYFDKWQLFDQIIVSSQLLANHKTGINLEGGADVFKRAWMLYKNNKTGEMVPNHTYGSKKYFGGPSDHLPVYIHLQELK